MPPPPPPRRGQHDLHHVAMMNGRDGNRRTNNDNGVKRSRKIWDEARRYSYGEVDDDESRAAITKRRLYAYCRAVCYELQPIRLNNQIQIDTMLSTIKSTISYTIFDICWNGIIKNIPYAIRILLQFLQTRTFYQWCIVAGVILYYYFVRFIHE